MVGELAVLTDPAFAVRIIHIIGAVTAVGAVVATDLLNGFMHFKPSFAETMAKIAPFLSLLVWTGFAILSASGLYLFLQQPAIVSTPMFQLKMLLVGIVFLNGIFLNVWVTPRFQELAPVWAEQTADVKQFEPMAAIAAAVSFIGWWSILILGYIIANG